MTAQNYPKYTFNKFSLEDASQLVPYEGYFMKHTS